MTPVVDCHKVLRPCLGERVGGDAAFHDVRDGTLFLAIVDVLGHGAEAHEVALQAEEFLRQNWTPDVVETMTGLHAELTGTRGAAAGLGALTLGTGELTYLGVGNTVARRFGRRPTDLVSFDGTLGARMRTPLPQHLTLEERDVLLLYTDGVRAHFRQEEYPQLHSDHPATIARTVVQRFGKSHDDAACIAARYER